MLESLSDSSIIGRGSDGYSYLYWYLSLFFCLYIGKYLKDIYKCCLCLKAKWYCMLLRQKHLVSLSSVILAFEEASGYMNYSHVKRMECNGSVHLCIIAVHGVADKPHNG